MNSYTLALTIISATALILSIVNMMFSYKESDHWLITRTKIEQMEENLEWLNQNNRRCLTCKIRKDRMCNLNILCSPNNDLS